MIQVFFSGQLSDEEVLAKFEGFAAAMRAILSQYDQVPDQIIPYEQEIPSPREHYFWLLTLDNGIRNMRASLDRLNGYHAALDTAGIAFETGIVPPAC